MSTRIRKVVFPVAGLGTRFLPATKVVPKEMLPIVDRPLIQWAVDEALEAGADTLVFVTNRNKRAISDHFDTAYEVETKLLASGKLELLALARDVIPRHIHTIYVTQSEALGLGHAVLQAKPVVGDEPFGVILPDDFIYERTGGALKQMAELYAESGASVIAVEHVPPDQTDRYGICATEALAGPVSRITGIVEKPKPAVAPSNLAVVGRYVLSPRIFTLLEQTKPGAGGEIQLTDAIAALLKEAPVHAYRFKGTRYDCGSKLGMVQAIVRMALEDPAMSTDVMDYLRRVSEPGLADGSNQAEPDAGGQEL